MAQLSVLATRETPCYVRKEIGGAKFSEVQRVACSMERERAKRATSGRTRSAEMQLADPGRVI